jgi:AAA+ ATPase superfamily predicted ATPase
MIQAFFHNRERERRVLQDAVASPRSELLIVYGRRGVGKSALLEWALAPSGSAYTFYRATRRTLPLQMQALTVAVREAFPDAFLPQPFADFSVFLDFLAHRASEQQAHGGPPVVAVIDELPYIADVEPGLLTEIQHWWDDNKRRPNLKLFLAGSYVAFMERQVLDVNAPLYNRRTGAMKLEPMDYAEASLFFPGYTSQEKMEAYAILGGMPSYLEQFDPAKTIAENVKTTILRRNTYLSEEPDWLLLEDLRKDTLYGSILQAIAKGERKPSDIARAIGKNSAQDIAPALETLRDLGLVAREVPITEGRQSRSRNSLYGIADAYLDFWYRFVDPSRSLIARGLGERLWEQTIVANLQEYISRPTFERACRQYLWRAFAAGKLPQELLFTDIGTWWGAGDKEIDVVAVDAENRVMLAGSCKWTTAPVDVPEYAALLADLKVVATHLRLDANAIGTADGPWLAMFSRAGFTSRLEELAARQQPQRLLLVTLETLYAVSREPWISERI